MKVGSGGIFEVAVDGKVVAKRSFLGFPSEHEIVDAVRKQLGK
jgi:selenoprotein W-related protein